MTNAQMAEEPPPPDREDDERLARLLERVEARGPRREDRDGRPPERDVVGFPTGGSAGAQHDAAVRSLPSFEGYPRIDGLRIRREIGRGGMGIVYEAEDQRLNRRVALKLLPFPAHLLPRQVERFKRESQAAAQLHHTNIVPVFGVGDQDGYHYYLMQYIEGSGLDAVLDQLCRPREGPTGPRETVSSRRVHDRGAPDLSNPPPVSYASGITAAEVARSLASGRFAETASFPLPADEPEAEDRSGDTAVSPPPIIPPELLPSDPPPVVLPGSGELSTQSDLKSPYFRAVARIGVQVAEALEYANRQGVLHRDIKPSNLLLDVRGNVWITDFGLAKTIEADGLTPTGDIVGTVRYMAPERFRGRCDARADVYSLGLSLYELAAQHPAFEDEDRFQLIERIRCGELPRLRTRRIEDPQRSRHDHPQGHRARAGPAVRDGRALADDLRRFLDGRTILARRASAPERAVRWCRRNPWAAASIAILVVGTVVGAWQAIRATQAETNAREQRKRAEAEARISRAVNEFLNTDLLAQSSPYVQATLGTRPEPDLKVRTALDRASEKIGERFRDQPLVEAAIRTTIGEAYQRLGLLPQARPHFERALQLRRAVLGPQDPETLVAMSRLGDLLAANAQWAEAEPLLFSAMDGLLHSRGPEHPQTLAAMNRVAALLVGRDKRDQAESLVNQLIDGCRRVLGPEHLETIDAVIKLVDLNLAKGQPAEAERLLNEALATLKRTVGDEHPSTLQIASRLASTYAQQNKGDEAEQLWTEVLRTQRRLLGGTHPDTLATMVELGGLMVVNQHKVNEAEPLLLEAMAGCRQAPDSNRIAMDGALANLGVIYMTKKDFQKLQACLIEAAEITRSWYGPDHGFTAVANYNAGTSLFYQKEHPRAEPYLRDSLAWYIRREPDHPTRFGSESVLGACLLSQKKYAEAEPLLISAYKGIRAREMNAPPQGASLLPMVVQQINVLIKEAGNLRDRAALDEIRADPVFQALSLDLQFPDDPFAPP